MTYEVQLDGLMPVKATAGNRKSAEQQAATMLLEQLNAAPQLEKEDKVVNTDGTDQQDATPPKPRRLVLPR